MEQRLKDFKKMLEYGKKFEDKFARWLINKGWFVIPKYLYVKEGAPLLLGKLNSYSLPDIDASQEGKRLWFECNGKKECYTIQLQVIQKKIIDVIKKFKK